MENSGRLFNCCHCKCQVFICSHCDRGNIYCRQCSASMRKKSVQAAGKKYQSTFLGKSKHAARQSRYRQSLVKKVTHQGSLVLANNALLLEEPNVVEVAKSDKEDQGYCCDFCNRQCSPYLRLDFKQVTLRDSTAFGRFLS
jgi:hypothetical protein